MAELWRRLVRAVSGDGDPDSEILAGVAAVIGVADPHVLAWGTGQRHGGPVTAVAVDEGLALVAGDGSSEAVAWHEVVKGGWRAETSTLWWSFLDGESDDVRLDRAGDLPEVFNDRVMASIVVREPIETQGGTAVVAGRRRLGSLDDGQILWTAMADGQADLTDPETERLVLERTAELKKEWR
ncbi:MAG: hypothetical protein LKI24_07415 [Acidipropionibacterium sp.]|jgi:hypothetical protein|nr:hypothetical protein [Acidipropionibacterium sp.]